MLCDSCKKNQATIHKISIINGEKTEQNLCQSCAAEQGSSIYLGDFLSGLFSNGEQKELTCKCGITYKEVEQTGMLGCSECYKTFSEQLTPLIKRIHGSLNHTGRVPKLKFQAPAPAESKSEVELLREELLKAVELEEFEKAAQLRDKIKLLSESGNGKEQPK